MGDYRPSPTAKAIEADAVKKVTDLDAEMAANREQVVDAISSLKEAVETRNGPMLALYLKRVEPTKKLLADTVRDATEALKAVKNLEGADDGAYLPANFKKVKELTQRADKIKTGLSGQLVELLALEKEALKASDGVAGGESDAVAKYAELEDRVNDKKEAMEKKEKDLKVQVAAADKAWAAKDQKKLTDARMKIIDMNFSQDAIDLGQLDRELAAFLKKYKDAGLSTDANWAKDEVFKLFGIADEGKKELKRLMDLKQVPVEKKEVKKPAKLSTAQIAALAKYFPFDPKEAKDAKMIARFGKVLNDEAHVKWPDALVKEFDWNKSDVQKGMSKANQLPYVKEMYLIDL